MSVTKQDVLKGLASARGFLEMVPNLPGITDDVVVGGAQLILTAAMGAVRGGRTPEEIASVLAVIGKADRLDVESAVHGWLEKRRAARAETEPAPADAIGEAP